MVNPLFSSRLIIYCMILSQVLPEPGKNLDDLVDLVAKG